MIKNDSKNYVSGLSKHVLIIFASLWGEALSFFLILGNFHPRILGAVAILLALMIQYVFVLVWKMNDVGNFDIKLGISMFVPIKYFLVGLFSLILPEEKFYFFGAYFLSMIAGYALLKIGGRKNLMK